MALVGGEMLLLLLAMVPSTLAPSQTGITVLLYNTPRYYSLVLPGHPFTLSQHYL